MSEAVARFLFDPPQSPSGDVFEAANEPVRRFPSPLVERPGWAGQRMSTNIEDRRGEQPDLIRDVMRELVNQQHRNRWFDEMMALPPYTGMPSPWSR